MKITCLLWLLVLTALPYAALAQTEPPIVSHPKLSLNDAILIAMHGNVTLKQRQADADDADADAHAAETEQKPSVSTTTYAAAGSAANILTSSPGVMPQNLFLVPSHGFLDQNVTLMLPLLTGGTLASHAASARTLKAAAQIEVGSARLAVTAQVAQAYAEAALQAALVESAQARLRAEDEQVRVTEEKVNAGRLAPVDLLREQAAQAEAQQEALAATGRQALTLVSLKTVLGLPQSSDLTLSDTLDALAAQTPDLPNTLDDALQAARRQRPEIEAARKRVEAAQAEVSALKGENAPQVYAVGMADVMTTAGGSARTGFTVGISASLPLADGGRRRAEVDGAAARLARANADVEQAQQTVDQEAASAWVTVQTATAQVGAAGIGVTAAQKSYDLATLRYNEGKSLTAERLDALAALGRAQGALAQAKADLVTSRYRLAAAVGLKLP